MEKKFLVKRQIMTTQYAYVEASSIEEVRKLIEEDDVSWSKEEVNGTDDEIFLLED